MGCDIHCYIEYRHAKDGGSWRPFGGRINPGRNYAVFELLAGVRGDETRAISAPRGLPDDVSYMAKDDNWLWIAYGGERGDDYVSPETAERYVSHGCRYRGEVHPYRSTRTDADGAVAVLTMNAEFVGKPQYVSHPDWHSHSWVAPDEWERAILEARGGWWPADPAYRAMLAAMRSLEKDGHAVRVVFWFDN
jgi:hypothetical protein